MKIPEACASYIYVGGRCTRQTFLRETLYLVWVLLNTDGKIISGVLNAQGKFEMMILHVCRQGGAMRTFIKILLVWFRDHKRNCTRYISIYW